MILWLNLLLFLFIIYILIKKYTINAQFVILNSFTYFLFYSLFYLLIPSILIDYTRITPFGEEIGNNILYTSWISFYITLIFLIAFILTSKINLNSVTNLKQTNKYILLIIKGLLWIVFLYIIGILLSNYEHLMHIYGNRRLQADFNSILLNKYKVYGLFSVQIILVCFMYLMHNKYKYKYLFFLMPFIFVDVLLSSRYLIVMSLLLSIILLSYNKIYIKIKTIILLLLVLILFGILRSSSLENMHLEDGLLEFLFTYASSFLILSSSYTASISDTFLHSIGNIFLLNPYDIFASDSYINYKTVMSELNPFADRMGLGGSLLTEIIAFKNNIIIMLIPIWLIFYGFVINFFLKNEFLWFRIYGILFLLLIFSFFRGSMFDNLFYPLRLMLFFGFWIFLLDVIKYKKSTILERVDTRKCN